MSFPLDKVNQFIAELQQLDEKDVEQVVIILEDYIKLKKEGIKSKPSDFIGFLKDKTIDVEKECKKLRQEWNRDF